MRRWRRWLPGPKHGVANIVAVFGSRGYARDADGLNELLGRWPALLSWADGHGRELDVVAVASRRFSTDGARLADVYADAVAGSAF
jgi:hypothetical protein